MSPSAPRRFSPGPIPASARLRLPTALMAALLAAGLAGQLGGCLDGGTSTDAGNPELVVGFRLDGRPVEFQGAIHIYADSVSPGFYTPIPDDGTSLAVARPIFGGASGNVFFPLNPSVTHVIGGRMLAHASDYRVLLPRLPATATDKDFVIAAEKGPHGGDSVQPFNIYVDARDSTSAFVRGLTYDPAARTYRNADGSAFDVLWIDLTPSAGFSGTVDTAGFAGRPLVVFTPGSPIAAQVHGNRFHLKNLPQAKLAAQLVAEDGILFAIDEPMDATDGQAGYRNELSPLIPGRPLDTLDLPVPTGVLEAPAASPPGPLDFTDSLAVTLSAQEGTTLYYTLDGTEPGLSSARYAGPIVLRGSATLKAVAYRKGINHSAASANNYVKVPPAPGANPASRAFRDSLAVALTTSAVGGLIRYTLDGSPPDAKSPIYSQPLILKSTAVLKAVTSVPGLNLSAITEEHYILVPDTLAQDTLPRP